MLRVAIEDELIVDRLVDSLRVLLPFREHVSLGLMVQNIGLDLIARGGFEFFGIVQCHDFSPVFLKVEGVYTLVNKMEKELTDRTQTILPYDLRSLPWRP
ncbi:hypothetical protein [Tunturiibacter psychrotolerans]|uniref:hypothetical protein n=1 Tax=Tunturiibacter psychrotolerans TaxID=3069686 RepID=UPI003D20D9BD